MPKEWAMQTLIPLLWVAGGIHLGIGVANFALPRRLRYRENLSKVSPIIRQIFVVHSLYIVVVVLLFAALCLFFAPDLAGASRLGRFLSAAMAVFWLLRIPLQLFYYDGELPKTASSMWPTRQWSAFCPESFSSPPWVYCDEPSAPQQASCSNQRAAWRSRLGRAGGRVAGRTD